MSKNHALESHGLTQGMTCWRNAIERNYFT